MKGSVYKPSFIFWSRLISIAISPIYIFYNLFRRDSKIKNLNQSSILVSEYHRIGDVLLIEPVLRSLKKTFPQSNLTLICNPLVNDLAKELQLADEIITFQAPWTNWEWSPRKWAQARTFAKSLQNKKIDIAIDFKGDLRNSWFIWHLKAKKSLGFTKTGGSYFYTNPQDFPDDLHQQKRAMELVATLGCKQITQNEKVNYNPSGSIVLHNGATDLRRSWPDEYWLDLIKLFSKDERVTMVKTKETIPLITLVRESDLEVDVYEGDLISFSNWLKKQKMFIGPDSMGGHLAARNNLPVVSLFGSQDPGMTAPIGEWVSIIQPETLCTHRETHWRLCHSCMKSIRPKVVYDNAKNLINKLNNK